MNAILSLFKINCNIWHYLFFILFDLFVKQKWYCNQNFPNDIQTYHLCHKQKSKPKFQFFFGVLSKRNPPKIPKKKLEFKKFHV